MFRSVREEFRFATAIWALMCGLALIVLWVDDSPPQRFGPHPGMLGFVMYNAMYAEYVVIALAEKYAESYRSKLRTSPVFWTCILLVLLGVNVFFFHTGSVDAVIYMIAATLAPMLTALALAVIFSLPGAPGAGKQRSQKR